MTVEATTVVSTLHVRSYISTADLSIRCGRPAIHGRMYVFAEKQSFPIGGLWEVRIAAW